jgi:polysaccharide export outer membrane protein
MNRAILVLALLAGWAGFSGCQSKPAVSKHSPAAVPAAVPAAPATPSAPMPGVSNSLALHEGDSVTISFPGAPSLNTTQTIRPDGQITLTMKGEMKAAGLTPSELEQELLKAYGDQLLVKEVSVVVQRATFKVFVTGAVLRPGPITSDRVMTPLEAVIEAGIDLTKSNLKKVVVIREHDNGISERFPLNLDAVMKGKPTRPFILKSMDKIYVPEKFTFL